LSVLSSSTFATPLAVDTGTYSYYQATAQASILTISADAGSPTNGAKLLFSFKDNGTPRALTWASSGTNFYAARGATPPTVTVASKWVYVGFIYNSNTSTWDCVATSQEA
jgi:hypothetical protein